MLKKTKVTYSKRICMSIEVFCLAFRWICALSVCWRGSAQTHWRCGEGWPNQPHPRLTAHTVKMELVERCRWRLKKIEKIFKLSKWGGRVAKEVKTDLEIFKNDGFLVLPRCTENGSWFLLFLRKEFALFLLKRTSSWDVRLDIRIINGFIPQFTFR